MKKCLVVLAKTPGLSPLKTRLAKKIGIEKTLEFYSLCKRCLERFSLLDSYYTYLATGEKEGSKDPFWSNFSAFHAEGRSLAEKQSFIFDRLLPTHNSVLLIGMDIPQIDPKLIESAFLNLERNDFVLGPTRDGGFYLFGSNKKVSKKVWTQTPWGSKETAKEFTRLLYSQPSLLRTLTDVDRYEDLDFVAKEMPSKMSLEQKDIVYWIKKLIRYTNSQD